MSLYTDSQAKGSISITPSNDKLTSSTISIEFHKGEFLNQEVDVYVSIACDSLDLRYGAKTPLLLKAYYGYVKKCGRIPVGKIAVIESGFLTSKWIFYAVGLKYDRKNSKQVMQKILLKCLKACDRLKACSIAFPALSSGGLNFPHDIAADIVVNTLESYLQSNCTTTNIKTVKLMVYMEDTYRLYAKFHKLLPRIPDDNTETQPTNISKGTLFAKPLKRAPAPLKSSHSTATHIVVKSFMVGYVKAETTEGDFTEDDSDVMVNSKVKNGWSGVASATLHKCGPEVQNIYDDFVSQGCEERVCVKYSTGGVKCKHVIHTIVPKSQKWLLGKMIATCLAYAEKLQCSSVSFPVIDTGNVDHDLDDVTYSVRSSIFLFDLAQSLHVENISNVCLQKTVCQLFKDKFLEQLSETGSGVEGVASGGQDMLLTSPQSKAPTLPLSMQISTADEMKVEKTTDQLKHINDEQYTVHKLFDQFVPKLSCKDIDAITRMSKHRHVEISIETTNNLSYIQLRGDRDDVANLKFEILQVLSHAHLVESTKYIAKLFYDKVKWQWLDSDNKYKDYEVLTNYHIEQAYCYNRDMIFIHKEVGEFNFNKMEMLSRDLSILPAKFLA
ncbi:protein mono-ADP-ribosyltransferase PARP14-like [Dysidea avara]|uniref:protein mono-ADP-ribosyltransferase PARP14-like n=1 Tax=Dysidea avara TaxID=196820 RepID=UPI00332A3437